MTDQTKPAPGVLARLAIDIGPILVFFLVNAFAPVPSVVRIFYATGAFMMAMLAAMLISQIKYRHISPMLWFSGGMVVVFGGITIWLHNETFIKIKPTIYYSCIAALLFFGLYTGRNLLKMVLEAAYPGLSERGWQLLSRNWAFFFLAMAVVNEAVWRNTTTEFWIGFKLWGALPATLLFAFANIPMLMKHGLQTEAPEDKAAFPPTE
jgi:intracellular septation protein